METTEKTPKGRAFGLARLAGSLVLAASILIGCGMLAKSFADNYYSSGGGSSFPDTFTAQINGGDSDYLSEREARRYTGLSQELWEYEEAVQLWQDWLDSGDLDGTYISFPLPPKEPGLETGVLRVYSKTRLDAWMEARFAQEGGHAN